MDPLESLVEQNLQGEFWGQIVFGQNNVADVLVAAVVLIVGYFGLRILHKVVLARVKSLVKKTKTDLDDMVVKAFDKLKPPFYVFLAVYFSLSMLRFEGILQTVFDTVVVVVVVYHVVIVAALFLDYVVDKRVKKVIDGETGLAGAALKQISRFVLWSVALLFVLSNLGIDITSLVAGLGIGGIAIALAAQSLLGDLFAYFTIFFDKPFKRGDFIIVGDKMGVIDKVGIKTTRITSLWGEEIIMTNSALTGSVIQNYGRMAERRVVFEFGIEYDTSAEKMRQIPDIVKGIVEQIEKVRFDRTHFKAFGDSALNYEVVYYVEDGDYNLYMDVNQQILLGVKEELEKLKVGFAFPTRTVHLVNS
jgi:small-conductance mechanosensitive channel